MTIPTLHFALFAPHEDLLRHAIFTRDGGVSREPFRSLNVSYSMGDDPASVAENRTRCADAHGTPIDRITTAGLVHGATVAAVERLGEDRLPDGSRLVRDVDALVTDRPDHGLLITAADCLQVLLFDPRRPAIGLAHAGWRGLVADVLGETVRAMRVRYGSVPASLLAGIGPGLGPCCARFSDPAHELPAHFQRFVQGSHVDLWAAAREGLRAAGLQTGHIEAMDRCTVCERDRFFSHRGDGGKTGRFAALVSLRGR